MPLHFCNTCHTWEKGIFTRAGEQFGICHNVAVALKVGMDSNGKTNLEEDGVLYTEEYFGCIYWRENGGGLFGTDKYANIKKKEDNDK